MVGLAIPLHILIPRLSDFLFEKIKKMDTTIKEKHAINKQKKLKKERVKKFKNKNSKKRLYKGEIVLKDIDDEE